MKALNEELTQQLARLPDAPGVYLFKDAGGEIIYIGKALSLRSRVRSYWNLNAWAERPKLYVMMPKVASLETILTNSEKEALLLEANLVRQRLPRYNVALKDDKRYPWLAITYDESFPRLIMVRDPNKFRKSNPKARIFGPYVEAGAMWQTVRILRKVFPMRQRRKPLFKDRPCMNYYIGLCLGPCQNLVAEPYYDLMVKQVELFLCGRQKEVLGELKRDMDRASQELDYEQAAKIRDRIGALNTVIEKQQVFFLKQTVNQDIIAEAHNDRLACISLLKIREGKLNSSEIITLPLVEKTSIQEAFGSFAGQYYTVCEDISLPRDIIVQHALEDTTALTELLSSRSGRQVKIHAPARGDKLRLIKMAQKNAQQALESQAAAQLLSDEQDLETLSELQKELKLRKLPERIECFDISNTQGVDNVASMVVLEGGRAKKSDYRMFKVRSVEGSANDFASMKEVVGRRYRRLIANDTGDGAASAADVKEGKRLPDLIVIDGGKGQLNAACDALSELGVSDQDIVGLAKKQEVIYFPGRAKPVALPRDSKALFVLMRARDEAHRFAVSYHRKLRANRSLKSGLDDLPGVGSGRRKILLDRFGSFDKIKSAPLEDLQAVPGLPANVAQSIYNSLHREVRAR